MKDRTPNTQRWGWVALSGSIVGNPESGYDTDYHWNGWFYATKDAAIAAGWQHRGSDDFNVAKVEYGQLVWFGWMDEKHPEKDYPSVAAQFGWGVPTRIAAELELTREAPTPVEPESAASGPSPTPSETRQDGTQRAAERLLRRGGHVEVPAGLLADLLQAVAHGTPLPITRAAHRVARSILGEPRDDR